MPLTHKLQCSLSEAPQVMAWTTYSSSRPGDLGTPGEGVGGVVALEHGQKLGSRTHVKLDKNV